MRALRPGDGASQEGLGVVKNDAKLRPRLRDAAPLRAFRDEYGKAARAGLLLHTGTTIERLTPDVLAAPWWWVC